MGLDENGKWVTVMDGRTGAQMAADREAHRLYMESAERRILDDFKIPPELLKGTMPGGLKNGD